MSGARTLAPLSRVKDEVMRTHNLPSRVTGKDGTRTLAPPRRSEDAGSGRLPAELRGELRRLLARLLVEDMRAYPPDFIGDSGATVTSPRGCDRGPEAERR